MSTYFSIVCDECKEQTDIARRGNPGLWSMMTETNSSVAEFIGRHEDHLDKIRVVSEHDSRYVEYAEMSIGGATN